jgi:GNAT superfamily N-acetyltransferase
MNTPRLSANFQIYDLFQAARHGLPNADVDAARRFVTGLTRETNGEDGPEFWSWMLEHLIERLMDDQRHARGTPRLPKISSLCDTFFAGRRSTGEVVGTISVVKDDRGRGARYGLAGLWIGGFNVHPDYQGLGLGASLLYAALELIRIGARELDEPVGINLFTKNPTVRRMADRHDFTLNGSLALNDDDAGNTHHYLTDARQLWS